MLPKIKKPVNPGFEGDLGGFFQWGGSSRYKQRTEPEEIKIKPKGKAVMDNHEAIGWFLFRALSTKAEFWQCTHLKLPDQFANLDCLNRAA